MGQAVRRSPPMQHLGPMWVEYKYKYKYKISTYRAIGTDMGLILNICDEMSVEMLWVDLLILPLLWIEIQCWLTCYNNKWCEEEPYKKTKIEHFPLQSTGGLLATGVQPPIAPRWEREKELKDNEKFALFAKSIEVWERFLSDDCFLKTLSQWENKAIIMFCAQGWSRRAEEGRQERAEATRLRYSYNTFMLYV